jgi:signal transduction histidine kinase
MIFWTIAMASSTGLMRWLRHCFLIQENTISNSAFLARWLPRLCVASFAFGLLRVAPIGLTWKNPDQEFSMLLYLTLSTFTAVASSSLPAVMPIFLSLMLGIWVVAIGGALRMFPTMGEFVLPCIILFCSAIIAQAIKANRFLERQVTLEEESKKLAEDFKEAKNIAEKALLEKNLFLTTASHDLRQPIHAMTLLVEAIKQRSKDKALEPVLQDLKSSMNAMSLMFNSLLDLSRLESGSIQARVTVVALKPIVEEVVILFKESAHSKGLNLKLHLPKREATAYADPFLLRQALINLIQNALRYTQKGGVLIGLRRHSLQWKIEVWDTGIGIAAEDQAQVFMPYFRSKQAWRLDSAGHGVGLAVVAKSAALMQATYGFQSRSDKGSCFWLGLNRSEETFELSKSVSLPLAAIPRSEHRLECRCLVLDDDPTILAAWKVMLESWAIEGRFSSTAAQAFAEIDHGFMPAVIFCDQRLRSGEDGFEVLKALLERCPNASGAMISGELESPQLLLAEQAGYIVLSKPLDVAKLYLLLETWSRVIER